MTSNANLDRQIIQFTNFWDALSVIRTNMRKSPTHSGSRTLT